MLFKQFFLYNICLSIFNGRVTLFICNYIIDISCLAIYSLALLLSLHKKILETIASCVLFTNTILHACNKYIHTYSLSVGILICLNLSLSLFNMQFTCGIILYYICRRCLAITISTFVKRFVRSNIL